MNPYKVLDVAEDASSKDIKNAYRTLSKEHHPDVGGDEGQFQIINLAYRVLSNPDKRRLYDEQGIIMDESPNHINNLVNARLANIAEKWLDNMLKGAATPLQVFALGGIREATSSINTANSQLAAMVEKAEKILNKLSCDNDSTIIHSTIKNRIATYKKGIEQNKTELVILTQLVDVIKGYTYEEEVQEVLQGSKPFFTSSTSFGGIWNAGS